ncbi:MAG TPA: hypothetical protein VKC60_13680 [Opitutaceae bacterium]|nr:hypothetical protein [Opitutaceae bacterium]
MNPLETIAGSPRHAGNDQRANRQSPQNRMNSLSERAWIRTLHLVLSIPIIGFIYGPVAHIPPAASFTRLIAVPIVALSGIWMWQKPRLLRWIRPRR